jgi:hypothetical protein
MNAEMAQEMPEEKRAQCHLSISRADARDGSEEPRDARTYPRKYHVWQKAKCMLRIALSLIGLLLSRVH